MSINKQQHFTQRVLAAYANIDNLRTKQLIQAFIRHAHQYVVETQLTDKEWEFTWDFMARMADFTGEERNEFLLLADVIGMSQLIEIVNDNRPDDAVGKALIGPFYRANAPHREKDASIASPDKAGRRVHIEGAVTDVNGVAIAGATVDVWQAGTDGLYEAQDPNQPKTELRGKFKTDEQGEYAFVGLWPTPYPVPHDGPVGELLQAAKRHPYRPAHIHFIVSAPGYETLITQVFIQGDDKIESDVVFTADDNMIGLIRQNDGQDTMEYNFQLLPGVSIYPEAPIKD